MNKRPRPGQNTTAARTPATPPETKHNATNPKKRSNKKRKKNGRKKGGKYFKILTFCDLSILHYHNNIK